MAAADPAGEQKPVASFFEPFSRRRSAHCEAGRISYILSINNHDVLTRSTSVHGFLLDGERGIDMAISCELGS
jgi:hypothetical protein